MKEDVAFRLKQAETAGLDFALPPKIADVVRIVRENELQVAVKNAAQHIDLRGERNGRGDWI
jgi:hypothetical protein